jgi:hypothetical protein
LEGTFNECDAQRHAHLPANYIIVAHPINKKRYNVSDSKRPQVAADGRPLMQATNGMILQPKTTTYYINLHTTE